MPKTAAKNRTDMLSAAECTINNGVERAQRESVNGRGNWLRTSFPAYFANSVAVAATCRSHGARPAGRQRCATICTTTETRCKAIIVASRTSNRESRTGGPPQPITVSIVIMLS